MDAFKDTVQQDHTSITEHKDNLFNDDLYDHFYYFDGVQKNFYPYYKRQRSHDNTENSVFTVRKKKPPMKSSSVISDVLL